MSTTKKAPSNKAIAKANPTNASIAVVESQTKGKSGKEVFNDFLDKVEKLEKLKARYRKLDEKRTKLIEAHTLMEDFTGISDYSENEETTEFPFKVQLTKKNYNSTETIFTLASPIVVKRFAEVLLKEVNQVLEMFEDDLLEFKKEISS